MQETDQSNERFHQLASAQYLQGKFEDALATWKQILTNNPEDDRVRRPAPRRVGRRRSDGS